MSADEIHLENLHTITLLLSGILAITLCVIIGIQLYEKSTVHAAVVLVMAAAGSDSFSSMFELIHLSLYAHNGIGSYAMVSLTVLCVCTSWTTCCGNEFSLTIFVQIVLRMQFLLIWKLYVIH